jgi:hypothetical protein
MSYNSLQQPTAFWTTKSNIAQIGSFFHRIFFFFRILKTKIFAKLRKNANQNINLSRRMILGLSLVLTLLFTSYHSLALTAKTTRNVIHGSAPYLTFDGGVTRATNVDELLAITLPDGTRITPSTNTSSASNPIQLQYANISFTQIGMFVPTNAGSAELNTLIGPPNNYWMDDDGDGQGSGGITATGYLTLSIVDKEGKAVDRRDTLDICSAPYKITLSSSEGTLSTRYGFPKHRNFSASSATYYINPKVPPTLCFARPTLRYGRASDDSRFYGPSNIWNPDKGFLVQSTVPSGYHRNFPTTGAHNLYFDLDIGGVSANQLTWSPVTHSGITATMTPDSSGTSVRVTLTGPHATSSQISSPSWIPRPALPATFELVGRDSRGNAVIKYGFELKQWFVNRGDYRGDHATQNSWCSSIGYQMPMVRDLTNGVYSNTISGASPSASWPYYMRHIDAGFFSEWGSVYDYTGASFDSYYWTGFARGRFWVSVRSEDGLINLHYPDHSYPAVCASVLRP